MAEPILTSALLGVASKAVVSLSVRASAPAWRSITQSALTQPRKLKKQREWTSLRQLRGQRKKLDRFLSSRLCLGLVEAYAVGYANSSTEPRRGVELADTFRAELARQLDVPNVDQLSRLIWDELTAIVRLTVDKLKNNGELAANDLIVLSRLDSARNRTDSILDVAIGGWHSLSADAERVRNALSLVENVRRAGANAYAEMLMPHAKENHRVKIDELYVGRMLQLLDIDVPPSRQRSKKANDDVTLVAEDDIIDRRLIILGNPGAGKTTFVRKLLYVTCKNDVDRLAPFVLELKSWAQQNASLLELLTAHLNASLQVDATEETLRDLLILGLGLVVFDGLDEVVDVNDRRKLVTAIESFSIRFPLARIVVSSRREGYESAPLDRLMFSSYRIPDYSLDQVDEYVTKWFDLMAGLEQVSDAESKAERFIAESVHAAELRTNPLMLSLLCLLYQYEGYIPENRSRVYEECSELLFYRWDRIRKVDTPVRSDARGRHLIEEIATHIFRRQASQSGERELVLRALIKDYLYANVVDDEFKAGEYADDFLEHCAGRAWLLTLMGTSARGERLFGFTHRTFMEYFAACHMARFASDAADLANVLRELIKSGSSDVICQLAIDRFGERTANGIDQVLRFLVFGSGSLELKYNRANLEFSTRALVFLQPAPRTTRAIARAALRESARTGDILNPAMMLLSDRFGTLLDGVCEDSISREANSSAEREIADGARLYLAESDAHKSNDISWLARNARRALVSRLLYGDIALQDYRRAVGTGCLTGFRGRSSAEGRVEGPLCQAISYSASSGHISKVLENMLRVIAQDPRWLMPMDEKGLNDLYERVAEISDWQHAFLFGARRPVLSQHVVGFGHMCAGMINEGVRLGISECVRSALWIGFGVTGADMPNLDDEYRLREIIATSPYVRLNASWRRYLKLDRVMTGEGEA